MYSPAAPSTGHHKPAQQQTAKVRFLIISDTHTVELMPELFTPDRPFRDPLPKADVLIHCGDLTMMGRLEEYQQTISMLDKIDAELKLVIAGNHDRSLDAAFWKDPEKPFMRDHADHERALELWTETAPRKGITYLDEDTHTFTLKSSGATFTVYSSQWTPAFGGWAFPYARAQDRFNPEKDLAPGRTCIAENPVPDFPGVDVMITHGPPKGHLDFTRSGEYAGCENLWRAVRRARPRLHCFGHIHEGWGAQVLEWDADGAKGEEEVKCKDVPVDMKKAAENSAAFFDGTTAGKGKGKISLSLGERTLLVNAAVMDGGYKPTQAPWLVDLDLPVKPQ
ncbi:MAG: hypothetical protein M1831_001462 [Alyxoria varia]|nr:MAG: hypothetical protein M1831_001462 [Alyxoria varia]